jgi:alpha-tubulin suppressor-like RCC1 family protein
MSATRTVRATRAARKAAIAILAAAAGVTGLAGPGLARAAGTPAPTVWGWGINDDFALGTGSLSSDSLSPVKVKLPKGTTVTSVRSGCDFSVAQTKTGLLAWGDNTFGQLGDATRKTRKTPVHVKLPKGTTVTAVRAGCDHTIALTKSGTVIAWGRGGNDQLGNGGNKNSGQPVQVKLPKGTKVKTISAGCQHSLALTSSGKVYAWGENAKGQLGDGTTKPRKNPVLVKLPSGTIATGVSAGCYFSFALTSQGLFGWGDDTFGQLGLAPVPSEPTPDLIPMLHRGPGPGTITQLFAGCSATVALFSKGAVLAWGDDSNGQLGDGGTMASYKPVTVMIPQDEKVHSVSAGCEDGYAQTTTGQVYAWGVGDSGELGNGSSSTSTSSTPVQVKLPITANPIAIGSGPAAFRAFALTIRATS